MRNKYQLSKADEKCRIIGALGTHSMLIGAVMCKASDMKALSIAICALGVAATVKAVCDLLKR